MKQYPISQGNNHSRYRQELLEKKAELLTALGLNSKRLAEKEKVTGEEMISVSQDEFLQLGLNRVIYGQLRQLESALDRLKTGEYGSCENCGSVISSNRLQAIPWAQFCVTCQDDAAQVEPQEFTTLRKAA